jgi:uncharacterized repeat protein (TIGR03803 family)
MTKYESAQNDRNQGSGSLASRLSCCFASIGLLAVTHLQAQTLTTLHSFNGAADGAEPQSPLVLSGNTLYGTTWRSGPTGNNGTAFRMNTDGTEFQLLHAFSDAEGDVGPSGPLALLDNALYGATLGNISGTVFKVNTNGSGLKVLYIFSGGNDGGNPFGGVILSTNTLYGTTDYPATVFKVNVDGTGFTTLHCLDCSTETNKATDIRSGLVLARGSLYGATGLGGTYNAGTVFKLSTDGSGFMHLHDFKVSEGSQPSGSLVLSGNTLYGTTWQSTNGGGTVFAINTDGTAFRVLHTFSGPDEGAWPLSGLIASGNTLYGTTYGVTLEPGGSGIQNGTVFAMNMDGTGFRTLYSFTGGDDGARPVAGLTLAGNALYGTSTVGGAFGGGTVFRLSLPATAAAIVRSQANIVVTWPTNSGSVLQSSTNLTTWVPVTPAPFIAKDQYIITNAISGTQQFYRLMQ